jgi:hypothetical protein
VAGPQSMDFAGQPIRNTFFMMLQKANCLWLLESWQGAPTWPVAMASILPSKAGRSGRKPPSWID